MTFPGFVYLEALLALLKRCAFFASLAFLLSAGLWVRHAVKQHDRDVAAAVKREILLHALDSVLTQREDSLAHLGARVDHDTLVVTQLVRRVQLDTLWRRDTVLVGDEPRLAVPMPTVARWDTTAARCLELAGDCAAFKRSATAQIGDLERKVQLLEARPERSCRGSFWLGAALGAGAGAYGESRIRR